MPSAIGSNAHQIYTAGIFLKDYRQVFNLLETVLTLKDIKTQGIYKLGHLLDILLMVGIPDELVLMGDNFESDPLIYASVVSLLEGRSKPWDLWQKLKQYPSFRSTLKQEGLLLNKIYQIAETLQTRSAPPS